MCGVRGVWRGLEGGRMTSPKKEVFRPGKRTRVIDFRGRPHDLCAAADLPDGTSSRLKWTVRMGDRHRWVHWVRIGASVLALVVVVNYMVMLMSSRPGRMSWYYVGVNFLSFGTAMAAAMFASQSAVDTAGKRAVEGCLKAEICPGCGYSLAGSVKEEDACVVCAECGGAWKVG